MSERIPTGPVQEQGPGEDPLFHYTRLFVRFLQVVFSTFPKGSYHWSPDEYVSDIDITAEAPPTREKGEMRPGIVVARGPFAYGNLAIDQLAGPRLNKGVLTPNVDNSTGARRYTDLVSASVSFNCMSREGAEASRLAHISGMSVRRLKRSLMKCGLHRVGEEVTFGSESTPGAMGGDSEAETVMVSVTIPFYFQDFWTSEPADKVLLQNVDMALTSQLNYPGPGAVALKAPGMNGKVLSYDKLVSLNSRVRVSSSSTPTKPLK